MRDEDRGRFWVNSWPAALLWGAFLLVVVVPLGGLLFAWSGVYNVAASAGHLAITRALLTLGLESSVRFHSAGIDAPPLDDTDLIRLGAGHYAGGCSACHGAPGVAINPIWRSMLPPPPDLAQAVPEWEARNLFWIVKHGIKYTAMPAWVAQQRDDEVWALVAFLRTLPSLDKAGYLDLANFGAARMTEAEPSGHAQVPEMLTVCARCHGDRDSLPTSRLVPRLAGQPAEFLAGALRAYADGSRFSGIMQPVAAELSEEDIATLSNYYSRLEQDPLRSQEEPTSEQLERGRELANSGAPDEAIPPCIACHGPDGAAEFPRLYGQHASYLLTQLRLFRARARGNSAQTQIMQAIAERLSERQMQDAALFFASADDRRASAAAPAAEGSP